MLPQRFFKMHENGLNVAYKQAKLIMKHVCIYFTLLTHTGISYCLILHGLIYYKSFSEHLWGEYRWSQCIIRPITQPTELDGKIFMTLRAVFACC